MKYLRPRSADSGLVTVLLVSDAELAMLVDSVSTTLKTATVYLDGKSIPAKVAPAWKKLKAELETARKAL